MDLALKDVIPQMGILPWSAFSFVFFHRMGIFDVDLFKYLDKPEEMGKFTRIYNIKMATCAPP